MRTALVLFIAAGISHAQDWDRQVRALRPADTKPQETAMLDELQQRAKASLDAIPRAHTRAEADRARPALRKRLTESLGYRLFPAPDLRARNVGTLARPGFRIEKLVYESFPGTQVPAHLYVPDNLKGPAPAILFYSGHWWPDAKTRPDFQAFCINAARLGFIVLAWDTFGQGERGISQRDHRHTESLLVGVAQQGIAEYETQCALRYLLSRKEVDPRRIGITGASGGGYNTWITAALDDRIAVAVPVVGTSDFYEQIAVTRALDWYHANEHCHFVPRLIRYANNHELLSMAAPKPLMIVAAGKDQSFPIKGVREVYEYGRELYGAYGIPDRIGFFEDTTEGHGYQVKKREAAYGWFLKFLLGRGDGKPYLEPATDIPPFDAPELRCLPPGQNQPAGPGIVAAVKKLAGAGKTAPWPKIETAGACPVEIGGARLQRVMFCTTPAFVLKPEAKSKGVLVAVDDRGKEALASDRTVLDALGAGWTIAGIDPRGIGETATAYKGWIAAVSLLLDDNFVRRQASDILRVMQSFREPVALYARGDNAALAAAFAIDQAPPHWYILRDGFGSFRNFLDRPESLKLSFELRAGPPQNTRPFDREIPFAYVPFQAFRHPDIPAMLAKSKGMMVDPIDGDWRRTSETPEAAVREFILKQ